MLHIVSTPDPVFHEHYIQNQALTDSYYNFFFQPRMVLVFFFCMYLAWALFSLSVDKAMECVGEKYLLLVGSCKTSSQWFV